MSIQGAGGGKNSSMSVKCNYINKCERVFVYLWYTGFRIKLKIYTVNHAAEVKSLCKCHFCLHGKGFL